MVPVDANVAVRHWMRIGARWRRHGHGGQQAGTYEPIVRSELRGAIGFLLERRDYMKVFRRPALHQLQQFGIGARWQNRSWLVFGRKLVDAGLVSVPGQRRGRAMDA